MSALPRTLRYFAAAFVPAALLVALGAWYLKYQDDRLALIYLQSGAQLATIYEQTTLRWATITAVLLALFGLGAWRLALALDAKADAHERLEGYATTDELTGMTNRRIFMERLKRHWAEFRRRPDFPVGVVAMDLDFFKRVNDTYGRAAGDAVLRHFARIVQASLRETDTAGRVGGEEFSVLLPGSDFAGVRAYAERVRAQLAAEPVAWGATPIAITVSIGASAFLKQDGRAEAALERADEALYRAKAAGRNRVEVADQARPLDHEPRGPDFRVSGTPEAGAECIA